MSEKEWNGKGISDGEELDLSSLEGDDTPREGSTSRRATEGAVGETLFRETVALIDSGELDIDDGIRLLRKSGGDGYSPAWIYLGNFYADEGKPRHNPALSLECFQKAADQGNGEGYYYLGLCRHWGLGCDQNDDLAIDALLKGAALGHTDCICTLGICREFGIGCEINYEMAVGLYSRASDEGSAVATNNLGGCYYYGHGVPQDLDRALALYRRAAEMGSSDAECRLGLLAEAGEEGENDPSLAFSHYKQSAAAKNPMGLYRLALCYDRGVGVEQNYAEAFRCYEEAAHYGNAEAMYEAGMMSLRGRGTKKDPSAAYKRLLAAAAAGNSNAEYEVGNCLFDGIGTLRDREQAYHHYLRAYEVDLNPRAILKLGICKLKGLGTEKDEKEAYRWFCRGALQNSRGATYMKGECLFYGVGVEEDLASAAKAFEQAISYDYSDGERLVPALLAMANCAERGLGVEQNISYALSLYRRAADYGDPTAMYALGRAGLSAARSQNAARARNEFAAARDLVLKAARKRYLPAMLLMGILADEGKGNAKKEDALQWYLSAINTEIESRMPTYDFPARFAEETERAVMARTNAQYRLGMLSVRLYSTPKEYMYAYENIALAASMGHEAAQVEVSKIYVSGGDLEEYYSGPFSREDACFADGSPTPDKETLGAALSKLGDTFFDGKSLKKNQAAAARCYKYAAELGNNEACYSYGWCLRHGVGLRENDREAVKWLKTAADRGNANACYSYGLCCEEGAGTGIKNRREALTYYRKAAAAGHADASHRYVLLSEGEE